ncbi:hypothetical protein C7212DRAFT_342962 [Tuber magnatum]|uniref:Uncharacterized protein n=1 Tax=Tuber magnatum TaxID=42249 RepID=A0A317SRN8_9PEZI|nr:hypothetical protein C7212DRAFT_342962 [Tuber magnatum]
MDAVQSCNCDSTLAAQIEKGDWLYTTSYATKSGPGNGLCDGKSVDVPATVGEARASVEPISTKKKKKGHQPQKFLREERVPEVNLDEFPGGGPCYGTAGRDAPMADVSATGPWDQPATAEEAQALLEPTTTEEARDAASYTVPGGLGERYPQVLFRHA